MFRNRKQKILFSAYNVSFIFLLVSRPPRSRHCRYRLGTIVLPIELTLFSAFGHSECLAYDCYAITRQEIPFSRTMALKKNPAIPFLIILRQLRHEWLVKLLPSIYFSGSRKILNNFFARDRRDELGTI